MLAEPVSPSWKRFLRFRMRGLLVFVLVIGAGLGWIVRDAHVQRDAVAAIQAAGGKVMYDWEWSDGKYIPGGKPWAPRWLVDRIGFYIGGDDEGRTAWRVAARPWIGDRRRQREVDARVVGGLELPAAARKGAGEWRQSGSLVGRDELPLLHRLDVSRRCNRVARGFSRRNG